MTKKTSNESTDQVNDPVDKGRPLKLLRDSFGKPPFGQPNYRQMFEESRIPIAAPTYDKPPDWTYWNRMPVVSWHEAILLTLNVDPKSVHLLSYPSGYGEIYDFVESHIADGSLKFLNEPAKTFRAVDWLQWLQRIDYPIPDGWRPAGFERPAPESTESDDQFEDRYKAHYEEGVTVAVAMVKSADVAAPTTWKQLTAYMVEHPDKCPVNCSTTKNNKTSTIERNIRAGGGHPLKDSRFPKVFAQNN